MVREEAVQEAVEEPAPAHRPPAPPPSMNPEDRPRRPHYLVVAGGLLVLLVVLFGGLRLAQVEIERRRTSAVPVAPLPTAAPTPAPTPGATAAPGMPEVTVEKVLEPDSPLAREIRAAEERYWRVYGEALYTLDVSHLSEVAAGSELQRMISVVEQLRARNWVLRHRIEYVAYIFNATDTKAFVNVAATDRSVTLDEATKQPIATAGRDPSEGVRAEYVFTYERISGTWKATDSFRVADQGG